MSTVNNDPRISCPNANWNGVTTNYCDGVTSDDTVAHEWGHAYTEYTSGLIYQWQSGALNESYSDVWGETVDLVNGREDEGEGDLAAKRPDGDCDAAHSPALRHAHHGSPAAVARTVRRRRRPFGRSRSPTTAVTGDVVVGDRRGQRRAARPPPTAARRSPTPSAVAGKWAYVDRGTVHLRTTRSTTPRPPAPPAS